LCFRMKSSLLERNGKT